VFISCRGRLTMFAVVELHVARPAEGVLTIVGRHSC
jgi:hypothetical protein